MKKIDTNEILLSYLLTCDPPADVNGREIFDETPMWTAASYNNTSAIKFLINFGGSRTIKTSFFHEKGTEVGIDSNDTTPLDIAKEKNNQETIELLTECFPSEE